jgi:hypothetical protein
MHREQGFVLHDVVAFGKGLQRSSGLGGWVVMCWRLLLGIGP